MRRLSFSTLGSLLALVAAVATTATPSEAQVADEPALAVGTHRPTIAFQLLEDDSRPTWTDLEDRPVLVDFWASWCQPCVAAFPEISRLESEYADRGLRFFSVTYEPAEFVQSFVAEHGLTTEVGIDADFETFDAFNAWAIPVVYLFDGDGTLAAALHPEHLDGDLLDAFLAGEPLDVEPAPAWSDPAGAKEYFGSLQAKLAEGAHASD